MLRKQTLRQLMIGVSLTMSSVSDGFIFGQMSGMINALQAKDSPIILTEEDISWIASAINVLCVMGFVVMGIITNFLGRKKAVTLINTPIAATWILVYFAEDKTTLLISRIFLGMCYGGVLFLMFIAIGEYTPPNIRPLCMNLITCVGSLLGTTLGHVLSLVLNWRYVALIGIIPSGLAAILPIFWVESPAWLASKGRFDECEKAFRKLHPSNESTDDELKLLLAYEKTKKKDIPIEKQKLLTFNVYLTALTKKYFWKTFILGSILCIYRVASGRLFFSTLAISMLKDITGTSDILWFTLIIDGFTTIAAVIGCLIVNRFKIRKILFISGVLANICLLIFALSLYLFPNNLPWFKISSLAVYFFVITAGPYPILDLLMSEIYPLEIKSFIIVIVGAFAFSSQFLSIKFASVMLVNIGYHGIFFLNAGVIFVCLIYMWFTLPETKGRSLSEIEFYFKNGTYDYNKVLFKPSQINDLLNKNLE